MLKNRLLLLGLALPVVLLSSPLAVAAAPPPPVAASTPYILDDGLWKAELRQGDPTQPDSYWKIGEFSRPDWNDLLRASHLRLYVSIPERVDLQAGDRIEMILANSLAHNEDLEFKIPYIVGDLLKFKDQSSSVRYFEHPDVVRHSGRPSEIEIATTEVGENGRKLSIILNDAIEKYPYLHGEYIEVDVPIELTQKRNYPISRTEYADIDRARTLDGRPFLNVELAQLASNGEKQQGVFFLNVEVPATVEGVRKFVCEALI